MKKKTIEKITKFKKSCKESKPKHNFSNRPYENIFISLIFIFVTKCFQ